jgi:MFS family permease
VLHLGLFVSCCGNTTEGQDAEQGQIGFVFSSFSIPIFFLSPVFGSVIRRIGYRICILGGLFCCVLCSTANVFVIYKTIIKQQKYPQANIINKKVWHWKAPVCCSSLCCLISQALHLFL